MMQDQLLQLPDGRNLGYSVYGPEEGRPVLYFHGTPSSRQEPLLVILYDIQLLQLLHQHRLRLIAVDRPGMGLSDFHEDRTFASFAQDVAFLMQYLQVGSCNLLCWSGGGPYALATAFHFPHMIHKVFIIAGFSCSFSDDEVYGQLGWNKMYFNTARTFPLGVHGMLEVVKHAPIRSPISQNLYDLAKADYAYLEDVEKLNGFLDLTIREAIRPGTDGAVQEAALYFTDYGFGLKEIQQPVHFWWGTDDFTVGYIHAKAMERNISHVVPHYKVGEGHVSIYIRYLPEVLAAIAVE